MITYGHEKFIEQAINAVLLQECNFDFDLIVCNDKSPDATDAVVKSIIENHPNGNKIKYFSHPENLGMIPNFYFALEKCTGKYIAICDGDDYWTDPLKLQKQVDFLESNPGYIIHSGNAQVETNGMLTTQILGGNDNAVFNITDFYTQNNLVTCTVLFRNIDLKPFQFFSNSFFGDWSLYVYLMKTSGLKAFRENSVFSVYRIQESGATFALQGIKKANLHLQQINLVKRYLGYRHYSTNDKNNINNYLIGKFRILALNKKFMPAVSVIFVNFKHCSYKIPFKKYLSGLKSMVIR
ncbi:Glycosyl transferase family 2 [Flavobacterium noncentrifugens]|uniref:Glycosyl transferase family 2 n=2 Tax=Flavobacterium noncentrifugens TaxID=1128970 RepID=A0A1G8V953_9FLAO|nr:Glycosyl transferase family 2 [Flavobacterium noncentrifugens]